MAGADMLPRFETIWVYQFRVVLLGDSTVGKSALLRRFTDGCFIEVWILFLILKTQFKYRMYKACYAQIK